MPCLAIHQPTISFLIFSLLIHRRKFLAKGVDVLVQVILIKDKLSANTSLSVYDKKNHYLTFHSVVRGLKVQYTVQFFKVCPHPVHFFPNSQWFTVSKESSGSYFL